MAKAGAKRGWRVTSSDRAALLRKYVLLSEWRKIKDAVADKIGDQKSATTREALRALSQEFPGALRELDVLGSSEIRRRVDQLTAHHHRAGADGQENVKAKSSKDSENGGDEWITWILAYHALMRAALVVKRVSGHARRLSAAKLPAIIRAASAAAGIPIDVDFVSAVVDPPAGRLAIVVFDALGARFKVPASQIAATLFPPRRPSPYRLSS